MEYRLFDGLRVLRDGRPLDLGGRKQRAVLAALLLDAGRVLPVDRLVERVWAGRAPARSGASLQAYVSNLRRVLEPDRRRGQPPSVLTTEAGGYRMAVGRGELDVARFEDLGAAGAAALAAGDAAEAAARLDEALGLWAPLLPDLAGEPWVADAAARLEARHAEIFEAAIEAKLALGHGRSLVADLEGAVAAHPFRERLRGQLAVALYRDGRQTEALRALADARRVLADEIGVEPGPELRELEAGILAHDPHLAPPPPDCVRTEHVGPSDARSQPLAARPAPQPPASGSGPAVATGGGVSAGPSDARSQPLAAGVVPLVGREAELAALVEAAGRAAGGHGRAVVVSGEPGVGKTRLVEELVAAVAADLQVAWVRCPEGSASAPSWACLQVADQLVAAGVLDHDAVRRVEQAGDAAADDRGADRLAFHTAVVAALRTATRPLLLVVDDLQWADPSSLRLLEFLVGDLRSLPILLVVTVRPLEADPSPRLVACLGEIARQAGGSHHLDLGGLSVADVSAWVAARGLEGDDPPRTGGRGARPGEIAELVHRRTGGNAFFVGEVVELLARRDPAGEHRGDVGVPAAVHDAVRRRVNLLPPDTQRLLSTASVLGNAIEVDVLARVDGRPAAGALEALDPAVDAGLLVEDPDRAVLGRLRFAHALVADALVAELTPSRRSRLHAAVTGALEDLRGADLDAHLPALVHHAREGAMAGTADRALDYAARAARRAAGQVAHEDAAAYWDQALQLLDLARPGDRRARYETLVELGTARQRADDLSGAQEALVDAVRVAEAMGDGEAAHRAVAALPHGTLWQVSNYGEVRPELVATLERLVAGDGGGGPAGGSGGGRSRAIALGALADALYYGPDHERTDRLSGAAVAAARRAGDPDTIVRALISRYRALWRTGTTLGRRQVADDLVEVVERHRLGPDQACLAYFARSAVAFELGERDPFEADLMRARELAVASRWPGHASQVGWFDASWLLVQGRYDAALARAAEVHLLHRRTRGWAADDVYVSYTVAVAHDRGRLDEVLGDVPDLDDSPFAGAFREVVAWMLTEDGRLDEARELVGPPGTVPEAPDDWLWQPIMNTAAHVRAALGDEEAAAILYERLLPSAGRLDLAGTGGPLAGAIDLGLARLAAIRGDLAAARPHAAAAVAVLERFGARPWLARSLLVQGELLARSDRDEDRRAAGAALARSRALATELGLVPVLRALDGTGAAGAAGVGAGGAGGQGGVQGGSKRAGA